MIWHSKKVGKKFRYLHRHLYVSNYLTEENLTQNKKEIFRFWHTRKSKYLKMVLEDQDLIIKSVLMVFSDLYFCVQGQNRRFFPYTGKYSQRKPLSWHIWRIVKKVSITAAPSFCTFYVMITCTPHTASVGQCINRIINVSFRKLCNKFLEKSNISKSGVVQL